MGVVSGAIWRAAQSPDMSGDMQLSDVSIETPGSDDSESMAMGLIVPLG